MTENEKTHVVRKTCLRILNDPYYFMILHVSNLCVINAFLAIDFYLNVEIMS